MGGAPIPSSHDTLTKWLHSAPPRSVAFKRFRLQELNEAEPRDEAVESLLVRALISARLERSLLAEYAKVLGWPRVQQWVSDSRMPLTSTCRRGVFGEVLVGQVLESLHEYLVPIWKDRFLITAGQSLPGLDGLALRMDGAKLKEVCYYEVKLRTTQDNQAAVKGYDQIRAEIGKPFPDLLHFVLARLSEQGSILFEPLLNYLSEREYAGIDETYRLGLVWEAGAWDDSVLGNLESKMEKLGEQSLDVLVIRLTGMIALTTQMFARVGVTKLSDDE